ncbi:MAG: transposase [Flavobacteriales bacterium]|nr:transposase [Flavobacteriales bacterium]
MYKIHSIDNLRIRKLLHKIQEITSTNVTNLNLIAKKCFPKVTHVMDRFHVYKHVFEPLQEIRIKHR